MCLSKQNYFSSSPSPNPRRRPSRTSVEDLGNFARLPCTPRFTAWARREPRRKPSGVAGAGGGGLQICMYANLKESDLLGNFFSLLKCGTAQSIVISPTKLFVGIDRRQR